MNFNRKINQRKWNDRSITGKKLMRDVMSQSEYVRYLTRGLGGLIRMLQLAAKEGIPYDSVSAVNLCFCQVEIENLISTIHGDTITYNKHTPSWPERNPLLS